MSLSSYRKETRRREIECEKMYLDLIVRQFEERIAALEEDNRRLQDAMATLLLTQDCPDVSSESSLQAEECDSSVADHVPTEGSMSRPISIPVREPGLSEFRYAGVVEWD